MKKAIITLIIGAALFLGGYIMKESAKNQMSWRYTYTPPYSNAKEARVANLYNTSGYIQIGGIMVAIAGGLWLIVISIKEKK